MDEELEELLTDLANAIAEVGDAYEFLRYDCAEDPDEIGAHNPTLLDATALIQDFVECHR